MKIIRMVASNIKRLSAVSIEPNGALVQISGKNGSGKSSTLDAIFWALAGRDKIDARPIREGQERAFVKLDLGEIVVERSFKRRDDGHTFTTELTVESPEGARYRSPQEFLDALAGEIAFDPLLFESAKPDERFDQIRRLLPAVDFEGVEKANQIDFDKRAEVNRRAKDLNARASAVVADMSVGDDIVSVATLTDQLASAATHNGEIESRRQRREQVASAAEEKRRGARGLRAAADKLREEADAKDALADKALAEAEELDAKLAAAEPLPEPLDVATLRADIAKADVHNAKVAARKSRLALFAQAKAAEEESAALTAAMDGRKEALRTAVAAAEFPVAGVAFEGKMVLLDGVPFEQASAGQRLKASVEIAMAMNPKLRVIRVKDGARLDDDNLALIGKLAAERDYQCWIETVGSKGVGIHIVDGHVDGQDPEAVLAEETGKRARKGAKAAP